QVGGALEDPKIGVAQMRLQPVGLDQRLGMTVQRHGRALLRFCLNLTCRRGCGHENMPSTLWRRVPPLGGGKDRAPAWAQEHGMELKGKRILVCNCEISMPLDGNRLAKACGVEGGCEVHTQLCRAQIDSFKTAVASGEPLVVGCTQEAALFEETRAEFGPDTAVAYTNIRERAGWAEEGKDALPKITALLAEATL